MNLRRGSRSYRKNIGGKIQKVRIIWLHEVKVVSVRLVPSHTNPESGASRKGLIYDAVMEEACLCKSCCCCPASTSDDDLPQGGKRTDFQVRALKAGSNFEANSKISATI